MRKPRSNKRQCNNLYAEKSLLLERKNLSRPLKHEKDVLSINKTTPKRKSKMEFCSRKSNELTKISKQQIPTADKFFSVRRCKEILEKLPQMSSKRAVKPTSRLKMTLHPEESTAADKIKTRLKSKKKQNVLNEKALHISQTKVLKSQNKSKGTQGQSELHHNNSVIGVSRFPQGSPNKTTRSLRYNIRLQSREFSKNNSGNGQSSISPKFKKQQDILNEKTPCIPKKLWPKFSNTIKRLEGQNEVYHNTVINVSGFINESPNETAGSSRRSMRLQSQEILSKELGNVQLSKLSISPEFKKQKSILNEKTPCMPKKLQRKSSNKMKEREGENDLQQTTVISVSGFINESQNDSARSSKRIMRSQEFHQSQSQEFLNKEQLSASPEFKKQQNSLNEKTPCVPKKLRLKSSDKIKGLQKQNQLHKTAVNVSEFINESPTERSSKKRKSKRLQSQEFLKNKSNHVQLSKLSVSPEFKKQQNILNEKTSCMPKQLQHKSSNKVKELEGQNEVHHKKAIIASGFINESPKRTTRSSRKIIRSESLEFLSKESDKVQLSKLSVSPEFKKQQTILNEKTPCMPKKLRLKSSDKIKELQKQNELHKIPVNVSEFVNESPNETARSSRKRKSKELQPQEFLKNNSDNIHLSKRRRNSTIQQKAKELMTPHKKSSKLFSFARNPFYIKKRCVRKSSEKLQNPMRPKSCINIPIDDLAISPSIKRQTKSEGHKLPGKNTLKRKRFLFETIKKADEEYEDDIYEEREFTSFINMLPDTSDSELSYSMATPSLGFSLTPQIRCKTPPYKDCFSPAQYALSRKIAEEYLYRNKKRKSKSKPEIPAAVPEKKKIEVDEILENVCKVQKEVEKLTVEESDCEDNYFSDDEK